MHFDFGRMSLMLAEKDTLIQFNTEFLNFMYMLASVRRRTDSKVGGHP